MAEGGFNWAPKRVQLRSRIALGAAVVRLWVGLIVLLAGLGLAALHFQGPREPAAIEQIVMARQNEAPPPRTTASTKAAAISARGVPNAGRNEPAAPVSLDRRSIVAGSVHTPDVSGQTVIAPDPPTEPLKGPELARALQKELRRVGCYQGEIDGDWGPMSKRAMSNFMGLANAKLPVEAPDHILLRLVQTYDGQSCGSCRSGETRNEAGGCVPTAVLAYQGKHRREGTDSGEGIFAPRIQSTWAAEQPAGRSVEPLPGRMSVGAPVEAALTQEGAAETNSLSTDDGDHRQAHRTVRRARVAERSSVPSYNRAPQPRQKGWTQTIFDEISRR